MSTTRVVTFGYDYGDPPKTADRVFDVRDLDSPPHRGQVWARAKHIAERLTPGDTVAVGCDHGQHRSVAVASRLPLLVGDLDIEHRDKESRA